MRKVAFNLLLILALAASISPVALALPQPVAAAVSGDEAVERQVAAPSAAPLPPVEPRAPEELREVPEEIRELFADGMSADEFVQMTGYVPRALEGLVEGEALMIIELDGDPVAVQAAALAAQKRPMSVNALDSAISRLEDVQAQLQPRLANLGVQVVSNYTTVYNGFQALVPLSRLNEIRALPGVKAVHRAPIHEPALGTSVDLIRASEVWQDLGYDGDGITIAVIDTGIDYTHAAFGGPGTAQAYVANNPDTVEPDTFPTAKVIGGYDFAGTTYNADPADTAYQPVPHPDFDPLDENGHGTHVASIAAGIAGGEVMTGTAPGATLMALKVFGRSGSTALTPDALEWATLQYLYTGKPEVINMSLGSRFGTGVDVSTVASNNAAAAGIVVVASAGNSGDTSYITGSPGAADRAISVAASTTGYVTGPTINISGTAYITQTDIVYTPSNFDAGGDFDEEVKAPLGYVGNLSGAADNELCSTAGISANALQGHVALIQRGTCAFSVKVNNAASLGAVAAIIYNNTAGVITMGGDPVVIPAGSIQMPDGMNLVPADGETIIVSAKDNVTTVPDPYTPADTIATFSSRGPRGTDSFLKPEITAPGVGIFAADMGSGTAGVSMGGTSMAAPHIAGVAALMAQANPMWTPEEVKAAMMNTAVDLADDTPIPRSGAGRVDAYRAVDTEVIAVGDDDLVSLNYGVGFTRNDTWDRTRQVTVHNQTGDVVTYTVDADFQTGSWTSGITVTVAPTQVVVPAGGSVDVDVTLSVDMTQIPVAYYYDGLEEVFGFVTLTPELMAPLSVGSDALRVPFYFQPRPYSQLDLEVDGTIVDPASDVATITMTHQGPITASTWLYPALIWNDTPDPSMAGPADVRLFGMDYGWTSGSYGDIIEVGINTWDYWHVPQPFFAEFDLYIDADQDGTWDYVNFNWDLGAFYGAGYFNEWWVIQVDLDTGMVYEASPYFVNTDYNASYMEWYLPTAWQDLGPTNSTFNYQLLSFEENSQSTYPPGRFDYARSPYGWTIANDAGPADDTALAEAWVYDLEGYIYSAPEGLMLVDYHGDPRNNNGGQAHFVPVDIPSAFVQVAHLAPFAEDASVDIAFNGLKLLNDVGYGDSTSYLELPPAEYLVEVFPAGTSTVALTATVDLASEAYYTVIATGDGVNQDLELVALADDLTAPAADTFHLRLGHLAPFASGDATADIRLQDGTPVLTDVVYSDVTGYLPLSAGTYDLKITTPGGDTTLIDLMPATFAEGQIVSVFATGDNDNQDLGAFALPADMEGDFLPLATYVQMAHLAPFAVDAGTAVTITLNGTPALTDFVYGDSTEYLVLEQGTYLVEVFPGSSITAAISATLDLEQAAYYTAIATGDGVNQDLELVALEDDLTAPAAGTFHLRLGHLAPFAAGTATADIRLQDGTSVKTGLSYGDVGSFVSLPVGEYDLIITTPGGDTTLINPQPVTFTEGQIVSAFATGDGDNQALGVFALPAGEEGSFLPLKLTQLVYLPIIMQAATP
jgi:minor extracellular serine protease Vpr